MRFGAGSPAGLTHGSAYTITGSGFGTKATAAPLAFEDFADGDLDVLSQAGITVINGGARTARSSYSARADFNVESGYFAYTAKTAPKWFVQYWLKLASNWHWGTTYQDGADYSTSNLKLLRFTPASPSSYSNVMYSADVPKAGNNVLRSTESTGANTYLARIQDVLTLDVWHCLQCEYGENSGVDAADGHSLVWIDGAAYDVATNVATNLSADGDAKNKCPGDIGLYSAWLVPGHDAPNMYASYADLYVDESWARVELGDSATYGSCTHREIQPITAWSDTSISITVNLGSFETGATVYPHVTHADGTRQVLSALTVG